MVSKVIYRYRKKFFYWDTYRSREKAIKIARYYYNKDGAKYHVRVEEKGYLFPYKVWILYFDRIISLR